MSFLTKVTAPLLAGLTLAAPVAASELQLQWYMDSDEQEAILRGILDQYTAAHPETTFNLQIVPYDSLRQKFDQFAASGEMPDMSLTTMLPTTIHPFLVDWSAVNGPDWIKDFVPGSADAAKLADGKVVAAPLDLTAVGMFYNADAFAKAGVALPDAATGTTWDEMLPKLKEVSEKAGIRFPLVWDVSPHRFMTFQFQYGNHIFSEDAPVSVAMDDAAWTKTLKDFIKITEDYMPPGLWSGASSDSPGDMFLNQQAVAYMSGSWQIPSFATKAEFKWVAGPTPKGTVQSSNVGGNYLIAFNTTKHLDEVTSFVNWLTSPEGQAIYAKAFGLLPANMKTKGVSYDSPDASAAVEAFLTELNNSPRYASTDQAWPQMQMVWDPLKQAVISAVAGQITPEEAVKQIHAAADAAIAASK